MQKRRRACEACHILKARCEPSDDGGEACDRCQRAGKECVPAARRLQRDRIAELEAQVEELTIALRAWSAGDSPSEGDTKKRKSSEDARVHFTSRKDPIYSTNAELAFIDDRVPLHIQKQVVDVYNHCHASVLPLVHAEPLDLADLRSRLPILLLSVLAFPTSGILQLDVQHDLVDCAMHDFASRLIAAGERSLDLAQALLIASFWFRARPGFKHATVLQIVQLSTSMAIDLGFAGIDATHDPSMWFDRSEQALSVEGCRTLLSCFLAGSAMTTVTRRPDANPWTPYHDISLGFLRTHAATAAQRTFCDTIQAELLCYRAVTRLELCDLSSPTILTSDFTKVCVSQIRQEIEDWKNQLPARSTLPELRLWKHVALAYLNEPVLHTATNKSTFSAPFLPERIAAADFACPTVTVDHVAALYALKDSCQAILDTAANLEPSFMLATSSLFYIPRVLYALLMLAKLYVAVTAPGNTYGAVLSRTELKLQSYFDKLRNLSASMSAVDHRSFNTLIIGAYKGIEDWYNSYSTIVEQYERDSAGGIVGAPVYFEPFDFDANLGVLEEDLKLPEDGSWLADLTPSQH
ncbi:Putative zn(2)-C6 fungal-type DNA-binding domain-containing protein [Septoria linicola]|uniref:Zn(2)-C6 fungal-type DNA-binding domain-containing protein n=1 Tax=Septoria linicola TaxID=215465 RepID=A0A9Q9EMD7_9PEZI|nr:putative zn(2)-C6 fungal-type DNA-binding domain-containing protein [Septoria linicola]USW55364.1 Putative zn(2)-C6 fungal-type DNA-binding domain-containing protein [Septoria linicola]